MVDDFVICDIFFVIVEYILNESSGWWVLFALDFLLRWQLLIERQVDVSIYYGGRSYYTDSSVGVLLKIIFKYL